MKRSMFLSNTLTFNNTTSHCSIFLTQMTVNQKVNHSVVLNQFHGPQHNLVQFRRRYQCVSLLVCQNLSSHEILKTSTAWTRVQSINAWKSLLHPVFFRFADDTIFLSKKKHLPLQLVSHHLIIERLMVAWKLQMKSAVSDLIPLHMQDIQAFSSILG